MTHRIHQRDVEGFSLGVSYLVN